MEDTERQRIVDDEHLRLLSIFYYISAGTTALFACIPIIHMLMGIFLIVAGESMAGETGEEPPAIAGWLICGFSGLIILLGWLIAFLKFLAGKYIARRQNRAFCLIVAGLTCLAMPYGTVLGTMTFIVLLRKSVKEQLAPRPALTPCPQSAKDD